MPDHGKPLPHKSGVREAPPELTLSDEMIARAAVAAEAATDEDGSWSHVAEAAIRAAFDGVPIANYSIGTLLQFFDHVICMKGAGAAVFVPNDDPHGFDSIPHRRNYSYRKDGSLSAISFSKLGDDDA